MPVTSIRMNDEELKRLDEMAKRKSLDRTHLIKKAIELGVRDMLIEDALDHYQRGGKCAWACAEEAGLTLWEFLEILKQREIFFKTDEAELDSALKEFKK